MTGHKREAKRILGSSELNDSERRATLGGNASRCPRLHSVVRERRFVNASLAVQFSIGTLSRCRGVCAERTCSESTGFKR
jgi:hypothetical protein